MNKIKTKAKIKLDSKFFIVIPSPPHLSYYGSLGISLLELVSSYDSQRLLREKLCIWLGKVLERSLQSEAVAVLIEYLVKNNAKNYLEDLKSEDFCESLSYSLLGLMDYFTMISPQINPLNTLIQEFKVFVEVTERKQVCAYGIQSELTIRLYKKADLYRPLIRKTGLICDLYRVLSCISNVPAETQEKYNILLRNHTRSDFFHKAQKFRIAKSEPCNHNALPYKSLCGKVHCAYCLKAILDVSQYPNSFCPCNLRISIKDYYEINKKCNFS